MGLNLKRSGFIIAKAGLLTGLLVSYMFYNDIRKAEYNLFDRKQPVEQGYFPNPGVLSVDWESNDSGNIETYILNRESGKKVAVMEDMLPSNEKIIEGIEQRIAMSNDSSLMYEVKRLNEQYFPVPVKEEKTYFWSNFLGRISERYFKEGQNE